MLRHRVIPVILLDGYSVLKTIRFQVRRNLGNPITVARIFNARNVDELILLDIDASKQNRCIDLFTIDDVASECFMPLTVGGGIKTCDEIETVLKKGADKVVINSAALAAPGFIKESAAHFGSQCIVVSVDIQKNEQGGYELYSHSHQPAQWDVLEWCSTVEALGAGEVFINSVDRDGVMCGFDYPLIKAISDCVKIPVIACGGASAPADFVLAIQSGASAVAAASIFYFTKITPEDCRRAMRYAQILVR